MMMSLKDAGFSYPGSATVFESLSLELKRREIVCLLGPSGCGKSTVLRVIAGLERLQQGRLQFEATEPAIGFAFQHAALMPWADVQTNIALPLRLKGPSDASVIEKSMAAVGLAGLGTRYPAQLSGGQQMRVSIARALVSNPEILLMDEPFAALDEILRFQMNELILELVADMGCGVLFVTHSLYEAAYIADRVLVMGEGQIIGEVAPGLDRSQAVSVQRASQGFADAVFAISELLTVRQTP